MNRTPKKRSCENDTLPSRRSVFEDVRPGGSFDVHRPAAITVLAVLDSFDALLVVCIIVTGGRSNATVAPFFSAALASVLVTMYGSAAPESFRFPTSV